MNNRPEKPTLTKGITSRLRRNAGSGRPAARRVTRRDQEARQQRVFLISVGLAALVVVLILVGGLGYEYIIKPNQVLAEVNGQQIKRRDYWKYESVVLYQQARLYENYATQSTGQQQQQFLGFAASLDAQRNDIWGSTDVNDTTVQNMIENQLYLDAAKEMGIELPDSAVELYALNTFAPADSPLITPVPTPTMIPARAEAATQTAVAAMGGTPVPSEGTPGAEATPVTNQATPLTDQATATPDAAGSPMANPSATPEGALDPMQTADAQFTNFQNQVFDKAHMSLDDYYRLFAEPQLAREQIDAQIENAVPQSAEQAHLQHILVATQELAQQLYDQANGGASFDSLARANSTDTLTSPTGGDLGWVTRGEIDPASADAAFALEPNQITQPIQTSFGWEIIRVVDKQQDRPLTDAQYEAARTKAASDWLLQQRESANIKTDHDAAPTPTPDAYEPPAGAPTVPPATPIPTVAPPVLGPEFVPAATPITGAETPVASPIGPDATPLSSPQAGATPAA